MAVDFSKFDEMMDQDLQDQVKNATEYTEVQDGDYIVTFDMLEIMLTKDGKKLMFAVQCDIKETSD